MPGLPSSTPETKAGGQGLGQHVVAISRPVWVSKQTNKQSKNKNLKPGKILGHRMLFLQLTQCNKVVQVPMPVLAFGVP